MDAGHLQNDHVDAAEPVGPNSEARSRLLRRSFWRRMVWLVAGLAVMVVAFSWQLGQARRATCRAALKHFARLARNGDLASTPSQILGQQWAGLSTDEAGFPPSHYVLITFNWPLSVKGDEKLPLAVCAKPHRILLHRGRHVLFRTAAGQKIEWLPEEKASVIFRSAEKLVHH